MIAIPLLAALLLQVADKAPQDPAALPPSSAPIISVPRRFTPEQEEQIKQKQEQFRISREPERQTAIRINELAGTIHSEADARKYVDAVAEDLTHHKHLLWTAQSYRHRVAHAEYEAVSGPSGLIPEQRIVDVWNEYVREIDAPEEALVTLAELRNFRELDLHSSRHNWDRDITQSLWSMPAIYAVDGDGNLADGCRAVEALKLIRKMHDQFFQLEAGRRRSLKETTSSGVVRSPGPGFTIAGIHAGYLFPGGAVPDPVNPAARRYQQEHGGHAYDQLVRRLFDELFPAE